MKTRISQRKCVKANCTEYKCCVNCCEVLLHLIYVFYLAFLASGFKAYLSLCRQLYIAQQTQEDVELSC